MNDAGGRVQEGEAFAELQYAFLDLQRSAFVIHVRNAEHVVRDLLRLHLARLKVCTARSQV